MLGAMGFASYALSRLAAKTRVFSYSRYALVAVPRAAMPKMPRGYRVRALDPAMLACFEIDVSQDTQLYRFAQGLTCLGAFNAKNELIGVNWVGTSRFVEDEVHVCFSVPENAGWDTGLWVKPQHRLGRGFAAIWAGTAQWLQEQGRDWSMSRIADYNLSSILSHKRMGAEMVGHVTAIRFFRWQWMNEGRPRVVRVDGGAPADIALDTPFT